MTTIRDLGIVTSTDVPQTQQRRSANTARTFPRVQAIRGQGAGDLQLVARQFTGYCNGISQNSSDFSKLLVMCIVRGRA